VRKAQSPVRCSLSHAQDVWSAACRLMQSSLAGYSGGQVRHCWPWLWRKAMSCCACHGGLAAPPLLVIGHATFVSHMTRYAGGGASEGADGSRRSSGGGRGGG
jgi:hypothetical protein